MDENERPESETPANDVVTELHELGKNLRQALRDAWESEERKKLQGEIETGLSDLGKMLSQAASEFAESPTGQGLKADVEDLHERIRSGEVEAKVRSDLLAALRTVNAELKKATQKGDPAEPGEPG